MGDLTPPHWDGDHHTDEARALVEKLQSPALIFLTDTPASASILSKIGHEAADLIETQAREIERLREALTRISNLSPAVTHGWAEEARQIARAALAGDSHV